MDSNHSGTDKSPAGSPTEQASDAAADEGILNRTRVIWELHSTLIEHLEDQFDRYDIDESGLCDTEAELSLLVTNVAYLAYDSYGLDVGTAEIEAMIKVCLPLIAEGHPPGINKPLFINLIVASFGFELADGSKPSRELMREQLLQQKKEAEETYPYGDPELQGFLEWWEELYGVEYLDEHPGPGPNGLDELTEQILDKAKLEFKCSVVRREWELKRAANIQEWRRCIRDRVDTSGCEAEEEHLKFEIAGAKLREKMARKERRVIGANPCWLDGSSFVSDDSALWQWSFRLRADPGWQWFMLGVNIVNVLGLMSQDTSCDPGDCGNDYQDTFLPVIDMVANVLFTVDMLNSMLVLGFRSYFRDAFNKLDFFVVLTGWLDVAQLGIIDFSAFRALRVLRPMRLVKYFKGIQAILGAIYFNIELIFNVTSFMVFFLIIFGILGITLFPGQLQARCVVQGAYPSLTPGITYLADDYSDAGEVGEMGEFEYFCSSSASGDPMPFPYKCAAYQVCDTTHGNPHHGATHFDNFGAAFLLMFQVQTLSTWYELDYWTEMTAGVFATLYYQGIIFLVGFIVSQLFIAVICFGFESLEEQLGEPVFSDLVVGLPYIEKETDPEDNLCACLNRPLDPLAGANQMEADRGQRDGVRVQVSFMHHDYPAAPLDELGQFEPKELGVEPNPIQLQEAQELHQKSDPEEELQEQPCEHEGPGVRSPGRADPYLEYRALMSRMKHQQAEQLEADQNKGFQVAEGSVEPREIQYRYDALKAWSNERVSSLEIMLRAQEAIHPENQLLLYQDDDGRPGEPLQNQRLSELAVAINDQEMPQLVLHVRSHIRVVVEALTNPHSPIPSLSLLGTQTVAEIKGLVLEQLVQSGELPEDTSAEQCALWAGGDVLVSEEASLWAVCLEQCEGFNPMSDEIFFALTIDPKEHFVLSALFDSVIIAIICANAVTLSMAHQSASPGFNSFLEVCEWVFNVVFTLELILKLVCLKGFCNYWRFNSNKFDFCIVAASWLNIVTSSAGVEISVIKVLRIFRALRVTKVLRKVESVKIIIDAAFDSMQPIMNILMFMMVVLVVYGCMGMQLYGSQFDFTEDEEYPPRENFDNFLMAFLSLFQVLTGSAWELVLYDCMRANQNWFLGVPFILSFFLLSNYIILNLFIGAILANMSVGTDEERLQFTTQKREQLTARQKSARAAQLYVSNKLCHAKAEGKLETQEDLTTLLDVMAQPCAQSTFVNSPIEGPRLGREVNNVALGLFGPYSPFRSNVYNLVRNPWFDLFILIVIVYSSVLLTFLNPDTASSDSWQAFFLGNDVVFLVIFTVEFLLKITAFGFIWCDNVELMLREESTLKELMLGDPGVPAYMYDPWNYLDLTVLLVSFVNLFGDTEGPLRPLRLLRAFRPLRMVNRIAGMKLVIFSLLDAVPALANVVILLFSVFLIFAILGLSLFMGKFQFCNDAESSYVGGSDRTECYGVVDGDYWVPKVWKNPDLDGFGQNSFDNIGAAFLVLFEVSSGDSWETVMFSMADVPSEEGKTPYRDDGPGSNALWALFCVVFVFMGQLFMMQLFVSVIIDSFSFTEGSGVLTQEQLMCNDVTKLNQMLEPEPRPEPPKGWRRSFFYLFTSARPLPVPEIQQCLDSQHIPNCRFVSDAVAMKRQIEATRQSLSVQEEPHVVHKMTKALTSLESTYADKLADLHVLEQFSIEALEGQQLPAGWIHTCGTWFDPVLTACIIVNIIFMCTVYHEQPQSWTDFLFYQNLFFLIIFSIEMGIKLIGLGCTGYWTSPYDAFDGVVVLASWIFVFLQAGSIAGIFRIGRVFRLIKRAPKIRALMSTLIRTIPSISNVFMVLLLVFFVFAVIGVELFGGTRYGFQLNDVANFTTWPSAMHLLWRCALGNWRGIMYDCMVMAPECTSCSGGDCDRTEDKYKGCGSLMLSTVYFVFFQVVATFAVLNLVIAIILNAFTWCYSLEPSEITGSLVLHALHLRHFKEIWDRFDLQGTGFIPTDQLQFLLAVVQYNVDALCYLGMVNQRDELMYRDYSSFGCGPGGADRDASEAQCRQNYNELVQKITLYERSLWVHNRLAEDGVDILNGDNTFIFSAEIDDEVISCPEDSEDAVLLKVRFSTLLSILVMDPLCLDEHDIFVCSQFRNPFQYRVPGYRAQDLKLLQSPASPLEELPPKLDAASPMQEGSVVPSMGSVVLEERPVDEFGRWCSDNRELCQGYFDRYDLDQSGTLNNGDELKFLTINVIKACKYELSLQEAEAVYGPACAKVEENPLSLEQFMEWFYENVYPIHAQKQAP